VFAANPSQLNLGINQIVSNKFPSMKVYVSVTDVAGEPIPLLVKSNFTVAIDGKQQSANITSEGFTYTEEGVSYFLLMDASGMMMGDPIEAEKKVVKNFINTLRKQDLVSVYAYAEETKAVFELQKKSDELIKKIDAVDLELGGAPNLLDQLNYIMDRTKEKTNTLARNVIVTLSEGRDAESQYNEDQVMQKTDEISIPIYSIGIPVPINEYERLDNIANHTGASYFSSKRLNDMNSRIILLQKQILECYVLKFSVNMQGDNKIHQFQIKVTNKDKETLATRNFFAYYSPPNFLFLFIVIIIIVLVIGAGVILLYLLEVTKQRKYAGTPQQKKCDKCGRIRKDDWNECLFCKYEKKPNK
jgi:VWFA-related protein